MQQRARVSAADIARLAGVGRAAVSNWRKRYHSFPSPVGGTAASPQFDLEQVERWLAEQGKLLSVADEDRLWRTLLAVVGDPADALAAAGEQLRGGDPLPVEGLRAALTAMSGKHGPRVAFEELWQRFADLPGQRAVTTPDALADVMVSLADVPGRTVLDPACGTGRLLRAAARSGAAGLYGQDNDPAAARLAGLWLAMNDQPGEIRTGDSLRHDAYPDLTVDAVVANLPFGLTNWGQEELGYDRRWEFGVPPRSEPELAWAQHALAHLGPGGRAVLLMPPSAASRRAGRRIRAELLRRGAIRAIIALPPGAAAPHAIGLHLWVLHRPQQTAADVLLVDAGAIELDAAYRSIVDAVAGNGGGPAHLVPVIDLLDDEVDLTPGRRAPHDDSGAGAAVALRESRERLADLIDQLPRLLPAMSDGPHPAAPLPTVSVGDLVRSGRLAIHGPVRAGSSEAEQPSDVAVLTVEDVMDGRHASPRAGWSPTPRVMVRAGDVVVPTMGPRLVAQVVAEGGSMLGRGLFLLRCAPGSLDPWFVAGHLRNSVNERQAISLSGSLRLDVRKAQVPRVPIEEQRRHGHIFRQLQLFDDAVRAAAVLSGELMRRTVDSLVAGVSTAAD